MFASASLGLSILTKGTSYMYAFPFLIWFILSQFKNIRHGFFKQAVIMVVLVMSINIGHYARNYDLFGKPLFPGTEHTTNAFRNEVHSVPAIISNIARYLALHLETPSNKVNDTIERGIKLLHNGIGMDIMDRRTTNPPLKEFKIRNSAVFHEDVTGNTIHLLLIMFAIALVPSVRGLRSDKKLPKYLTAAVAGFLIYSFLLKWSPWSSRHHQPLFVIFSPFVAVVFSRVFSFKTTNLIAIFLILAALPSVFLNETRPILKKNNIFNTPRDLMYLKYPEQLKYLSIVNQVQSQNCTNIGVEGVDDSFFEYLFWHFVNDNPDKKFRIEHINLNNISARKYATYPFNSFEPCFSVRIKQE